MITGNLLRLRRRDKVFEVDKVFKVDNVAEGNLPYRFKSGSVYNTATFLRSLKTLGPLETLKDFMPPSFYNSNNPSGNTSFIVRRSKSIAAMNSSAAGIRCCLPPISISKSGFTSLS